MDIVVSEENHHRVTWEGHSPLIVIEIALVAGVLIFVALVAFSPSPLRWPAIGVVTGVVIALGLVLALTTPLIERGHLERLPEGGDVERSCVWLIRGTHLQLNLDLEDVEDFRMEVEVFEDAPPETYVLARLWVRATDGTSQRLTPWAPQASVQQLGETLAKVARRRFEIM